MIIEGGAGSENNGLSALRMKNPLGMKRICDFKSFPSIFPDTYFEFFFFWFLLSLLEYKCIPLYTCSTVSSYLQIMCRKTESRVLMRCEGLM